MHQIALTPWLLS